MRPVTFSRSLAHSYGVFYGRELVASQTQNFLIPSAAMWSRLMDATLTDSGNSGFGGPVPRCRPGTNAPHTTMEPIPRSYSGMRGSPLNRTSARQSVGASAWSSAKVSAMNRGS